MKLTSHGENNSAIIHICNYENLPPVHFATKIREIIGKKTKSREVDNIFLSYKNGILQPDLEFVKHPSQVILPVSILQPSS